MDGLRQLLERRWVQHMLVAALLSALLLPNIGLGLYDPWESHYAEVARRVDLDGDWLTLRWHSDSRLAHQVNPRCRNAPEECTFFSKPVLIFWLMALSYRILGVGDAAARLPMTLVGIAGIVAAYWYLRRMLGLRTGLLAAAVLATTPFYYMLSRQIMTDIAFVVPMTVGLLALAYYLFFEGVARRHLYLFYAMVGLATLAKGLLGFLLPGAIVFVVLLLQPRQFLATLRQLRIPEGAAIFLAVAGPWYGAMWVIHGDVWFDEFIIKHHFRRAGEGVHGERGGWGYFLPQLYTGLWPWTALAPAALLGALGTVAGAFRRRERLAGKTGLVAFLACWAIVAFVVFSYSKTKFHHYIFPAVPALSMLVAAMLARAWAEGPSLVTKALALAGAGLLGWYARGLLDEPYRFINLFIYGYERRYPEIAAAETWLGFALALFAIGLLFFLIPRMAKPAAAVLFLGAVVATGWNVHGYMVALEPTLSLRNAFEAWERERQPGDRLYEWALRWRGEVWYSRDTNHEIPQRSIDAMRRELARPGRAFIVTTSPDALSQRTRRLFGRPVRVINDRPDRYAMTLWEGPPEGTGRQHLVSSVPESATEVGGRFGEGVELLAFEARPATVRPGGEVELTLYFRCRQPLRREWTVFVHADHPEGGRRMRMLSDHPPADGLLPTTRWQQGQIIRDQSSLVARDDQAAGDYELYVGLFRDGEGRMPVTSGQSDGEDRLRLGTIAVSP